MVDGAGNNWHGPGDGAYPPIESSLPRNRCRMDPARPRKPIIAGGMADWSGRCDRPIAGTLAASLRRVWRGLFDSTVEPPEGWYSGSQ
jgi:hypothetical protein